MCLTASPTMPRPGCSTSPANAGARSSSDASAISSREQLKQRRRTADRQRAEHDAPIDEAQWHADRRLAFEGRALPDRVETDQDAGSRVLARNAAKPGQQLVELVDGGADASLRHHRF